MSYKLINASNLNVFLEDIGVRLNGKGATATISDHDYLNSKSVKELSRLLTVVQKSNFSVWPLSRRPKLMIPVNSIPVDNSKKSGETTVFPVKKVSESKVEPIKPVEIKPVEIKPVGPESKIDVLLSKMTDLIEKLHSLPLSTSQSSIQMVQSTPIVQPDEIFIPNRVVPDKADVKINLQEKSQEVSGVEEAAKALKKLRTKK